MTNGSDENGEENGPKVTIEENGGLGRLTVAGKKKETPKQLKDVLDTVSEEYYTAVKEAYLGSIKIAQSVKDPDAKIMLLRQVYDSATKREVEVKNGLNYNAPRPNMLKNRGMTGIDVVEEEFTSSAFSNPLPEVLFNRLRMMEQRAEADFSKFALPMDVAGKPVTDQTILEGLRQVRDMIDDVGGIHYEIVKWGLYLYVLVSMLHDAYHSRRFLAIKAQVELTLGQYNAHSPYLALRLEEREILGAQSLVAIAVALRRYLTDPEFAAIKMALQGKSKGKTPTSTPPASAGNSLPDQLGITEGLIAMISGQVGPRGQWVPRTKPSGRGKKVATVASFTVAPAPQIDLTQDPVALCQTLQNTLLQYINISLATIRDAKLVAAGINFDIYTGQWGATASVHENITMMDTMRRDLLDFFISGWERTSFLVPKFFVVDQYYTYTFMGAYGPGTSVHTLTLGLAEEREVRIKTTETTKESRSKNSSLFDSYNQSAQESLEQSEEQELTSSNVSMEEVASYIDTNRTADSSKADAWGLKAGIKASVVTAEASINHNEDSSVSAGVDQGSNSTINNTREESARRTTGTIANHTRDVSSKRDASVSEATESSTDVTKEESMTVKIKNPNRAAPLTVIFMNMVQEYRTYMCLVNIRLMFSNGVFKREVQISDIDKLLDLFLRPEATKTRQRIKDIVAASAKVLDYQNRLLDLLDSSKSKPAIKNILYIDLLQEKIERSGEKMDARDVEMMIYKKYIKGVVLSEETFTLPTPGLFVQAVVGRPALDENEQRLFEIDARRQENEVTSLEKKTALIDKFVETLDQITDPVQRAQMLVLVMASGKEIFNNMYAASLMGSSIGGSLPDNFKALAKSLKLDLK